MSISQAIELRAQMQKPGPAQPPRHMEMDGAGFSAQRRALLDSLAQFNEAAADRIISEAYAMHGPEEVGEHLIAPVLAQVGERWHRGKISVATEHFASSYLRRKLDALINAVPRREEGPLIVLGCAPNDWHELGVLLFHLLLRRRGHRVLYLGQNVPVTEFADEMRRLRPAMIIISAATEETVSGLIELAHAVQTLQQPRLVFGFAGGIFNRRPELRDAVPGIFLGERLQDAVVTTESLLAERVSAPAGPLAQLRA
jgi:methanogenic corrinoid protein MtbC1